jgi:cbb3-type cytochrome oxidase subunit 3
MKKNKSKKTLIIILIIILVVILAWIYVKNKEQENNNIIANNNVNLNETVNNEDIENKINYKKDKGLSLENPQVNERLSSPVSIKGEAIGSWYFEANFRVKLVNRESGDIISQSYVTALDNWMTEESVDFEGILEFNVNKETKALLILESANPSGLIENQMTYTVPVILNVSN